VKYLPCSNTISFTSKLTYSIDMCAIRQSLQAMRTVCSPQHLPLRETTKHTGSFLSLWKWLSWLPQDRHRQEGVSPCGCRRRVCVPVSTGSELKLINTVSQRNIPNGFDFNLKQDYWMLIIFGMNISETAGLWPTVQFSTSPNVYFCISWENKTSRMCVEMSTIRQKCFWYYLF